MAQGLSPGKTLMFAHGFNIHFGEIVPPAGRGRVAWSRPSRRAIWCGASSRRAAACRRWWRCTRTRAARRWPTRWPTPSGIGCTRAGVIETTFREETETDLFGEQAVLCGGVTALVKAGFETLTAAGYRPEMAYFECLHELKLIVDLMYRGGMQFMRYSISDTAEYGDYTRGPRIVTDETRAEMRRILDEIQNGSFAREWLAENRAGRPNFERMRQADRDHEIEQVGAQLRAMMPWSEEGKAAAGERGARAPRSPAAAGSRRRSRDALRGPCSTRSGTPTSSHRRSRAGRRCSTSTASGPRGHLAPGVRGPAAGGTAGAAARPHAWPRWTTTSPPATGGSRSPTRSRRGRSPPLVRNAREFGVELFDLESPEQGIVHVIGPELGLTQPGMIIVCGDSHTSTHGAFGALAFGIGTSEVEHVLATQCIVQARPRTMEVRFDGRAGRRGRRPRTWSSR